MRPAATHYSLGTCPVTGVGLGVSSECLDDALDGPIQALIFDDTGTEQVTLLLDGLADTEFSRENLDSLLADDREPEDWRVGEALAESYLTDNRDCFFPWPDGRDERKRGSSLPGADLMGFQREGEQDRFAFGEVKTSGENKYPPATMYGRHGLKQQVEELRDRQDIREGLVLYLGHRAVNAPWTNRYRSACSVYLRDTCDVRVFGLLVRDVEPNEADLQARVCRLDTGCPAAMRIEMTALYLPSGSIDTLAERVVASRPKGGTR